MTLDQTDPTFVQDLKDSERFVDLAINYFLNMGYSIYKPVTKIRPNVYVRSAYSDRGDFQIAEMKGDFGQGWADVKHLSFSFPLPFDDIIVCPKHEFDKNPCCLYFQLNKEANQALIIAGETFRDWTLVKKMACAGPKSDAKEKRMREFYTAPKKLFELVWVK